MAPASATLKYGDHSVDLPVKAGTIGPSVVDIGKLYGQTGMFTFDPGFTSTASTEVGATTIGRANSAWALSGTISSASTSGHTTGPPALKL